MRRQAGFTLVEVLLIILVVTVIGFGGYYVWSQQQSDDQGSTSQQSTNNENAENTESNTEEALPAGFVLYENEDLGFEFIHPESWGDVEVSRFERQHDGAQYYIVFSESKVVGAIATEDYEYTGPAMGGVGREINANSSRQDFSEQNIAASGDAYVVGALSLCQYMGEILLRSYVNDLDNFSLLQFTYPYQVQPDFDCVEEGSENNNLLQFFDDELISDFEAIATYDKQQ